LLFSKSVEYALRAVVWLGQQRQQQDNQPLAVPASQIAAATQIPARFLADILQKLARSGIITAQRGPHGGFTLNRSAEQIRLLDIVTVIDPIQRVGTCPLTGLQRHDKLCRLHQTLDDLLARMEEAFDQTTVADMACLAHHDPPAVDPAATR
jgi:Rrf2 family protein